MDNPVETMELDPQTGSVTVVVDGVHHRLDMGSVGAQDTAAVRSQLGMSFRRLIELLAEDPDLDIIAAIVWLSRRHRGETSVPYAAVAATLGYDSNLQMLFNGVDLETGETVPDPADDEGEPSPEG